MKLALRHVYYIYARSVRSRAGVYRVQFINWPRAQPGIWSEISTRRWQVLRLCRRKWEKQHLRRRKSISRSRCLLPAMRFEGYCKLALYSPPPEKLACCAPHNASGDGESKVSSLLILYCHLRNLLQLSVKTTMASAI
jgi:hypothetical protein